MQDAALNILLVDDDHGDVKLTTRAIERSGLKANCAEAVSGPSALRLCESTAFDCAIVDYMLPGEDGLQTLAAIAREYPSIALIMATGQGDENIATEAMKIGAADYIRKSAISPDSIRRAIENAVTKCHLRRKVAEQQNELARFADVLVHDLRAPTSSIQTFIWDMQDALRKGEMDSLDQYLEWIVNAAARMDTLIATLYQYTRADGEVEFGTVAMDAVFESALANLHNIIQKGHAVVTSDPLPNIAGNEPQLTQLLQNLIGNAIKYCQSPTPRIHVRAKLSEDSTWALSVRDNGIGIPDKDLKRIFEPFTRLHGADTYEGTGLGLATCRKIVSRHGGEIWAESTVGAGTTIFFTLNADAVAVVSAGQSLAHAA